MDESRQIILFGAGDFGRKALEYFGEDRVAYFVDNNAELTGSLINGKKVLSFDQLKATKDDYQIVISVGTKVLPILAKQLEDNGITDYVTYLDLVNHLKKPSGGTVSWLDTCKKAADWIKKNSVPGEGIINTTKYRKSYPEVTGYYIPTLMRWGFSDLAISYANWLISIQHDDGSWYDTEGKDPYVFDTAQVLKGLLAVRDRVEGLDAVIKKGCDWILSNIQESGRLTTPSEDDWGDPGFCSELIHLYCLSPLYEAADVYGESKYREAADRVADYYCTEHIDEIKNFGFFAHFYAYVMEALCDIGRKELAKECMNQMDQLLDEKGYVPGYNDVNWVCSTAIFQFAIVWFKLGDLDRGNKALIYATKLQNESGGWFGSYPTVDAPKAVDRKEFPDYLADAEISWAVKFFFDALYYRNKLDFEKQAHIFNDSLAKDDGRYQVVSTEMNNTKARAVCDVGCGKGAYLKNLLQDFPDSKYYAVDIADNVMKDIKLPIEKRGGMLTWIPYKDAAFDLTYTAEALEHSIFQENAVKEMLRVTKPGGEVIVIDKNKSALGELEIDEWEQWFTDEFFEKIAKEEGCELRIVNNLSYDDGKADGLFNAWILKK